ncbi:MAG: aldehyde dehydrogenase family protein [Kineosporiaceae bacterium]
MATDTDPSPAVQDRAVRDLPVDDVVAGCARAASAAAASLAAASDDDVDRALAGMAARLGAARDAVLDANAADVAAARECGTGPALLDRLALGQQRVEDMAGQLRVLAGIPHEPGSRVVRELPGDLVLLERRRPVGVIGANYEARPNVTVDIAGQLVKSRNAGVLRTGSAALRSSTALVDHVVAPSLAEVGVDPAAVQLIPSPAREAAFSLMRLPRLVPLVIVRGSGESTRALAREAARHDVRVLAHADGGGVLYVHPDADRAKVRDLVTRSVDRLGVCNRLNLLLVDDAVHDELVPELTALLSGLGIAVSLPPHDHPRGHEWALDDARSATVTVDRVSGPLEAARVANEETSGLAAGIATEDVAAAEAFLAAYTGTGVFWNAPTRLLDGFRLLAIPETGINLDRVPGPRGPVTFRDLTVRQYAVVPAGRAPAGT